MRRVVIHRPGGHDRLLLEDVPDPRPGPGEVLVETAAVGVNYADTAVRMGLYASAKKYVGWPITPGFEFAGRVVAVGAGVAETDVGREVLGVTRFGGWSTHVVVPRAQLFAIPPGWSASEAAAFPAVHLTAWYAFCELARPEPDSAVLVHSAAGGVGSVLVQLGRNAHCRVVGVVGAGHKVEVARQLGASVVVDKSRQDLWREAERAAPGGFAAVFDANGVQTLRQSYRHLAEPGRLVVYGFATMLRRGRDRPNWPKLAWDWLRTPRFSPLEMTETNRSVSAFNLSFLFPRLDLLGPAMGQLLEWAREGRLARPRVREFSLAEAAEAQRAIESGETVGKLVLVP